MGVLRDRFTILFRNKFFEQTTLSIYALINTAKRGLEVFFWYSLLLLFFVFTLRNLTEVIVHYLSKPTATVARVLPDTSNATIPNFGLMAHMPFNELKAPPLRKLEIAQDQYNHQHYQCLTLSKEQTILPEETKTYDATMQAPKPDINITSMREDWESWSTKLKEIHVPKLDSTVSDCFRLRTLSSLSVRKRQVLLSDRIEKVNAAIEGIRYTEWTPLMDALRTMSTVKHEQLSNTSATNMHDLFEGVKNSLPFFVQLNDRKWKTSIGDWQEDDQGQEMLFLATTTEPTQHVRVDIYSGRMVTQLLHFQALRMYLNRFFMMDDLAVRSFRGILDGTFLMCVYDFLIEELASAYDDLIHLYQKSVRVELILDGTVVPLGSLGQTTVTLSPSARLISHTTDCHPTTLSYCIDQCQLDRHRESCDCYPWWLGYLVIVDDTSNSICDKYCGDWKHECEVMCEEKGARVCDQTLFTYSYTTQKMDYYSDQWIDIDGHPHIYETYLAYQPLATVLINITQIAMHPVYAEHYSMGFNQFMAEIGAVWEFWLGANIFGLTHLLIYIMRNAHHASTKRAAKAVQDMKRKQELLETGIGNLRNQLAELKKVPNGSRATGRWSWWLYNEFYETTEISGFSFINTSKRKSEKVFWYVFIICCGMWAVINGTAVFGKYYASPTITHMHVSIENNHTNAYGNISLSIQSSLFEHSATPLPNLERIFEYATHVCHGSDHAGTFYGGMPDKNDIERRAQVLLYGHTYTRHPPAYDLFIENMADELNKNLAPTWQEYYTQMSESLKKDLEKFWPNSYYFSHTGSRLEFWDDFYDAIKTSNKYIWQGMFGALILLRAIELGQDPKVVADMTMSSNIEQISSNASARLLAEHGVTMEHLVATINEHIRRQTWLSSGEVYLKQWSYDPFLITQSSTIEISYPKNETELKVESYSMNMARHLIMMQSITDTFINYSNNTKCKAQCVHNGPCHESVLCDEVLACFGGGDLGRKVAVHQMAQLGLFDSLMTHYKWTVVTAHVAGLHIPIQQLVTSHIELQAMVRYTSELEGCYNDPLAVCLDQCALQNHNEQCGCMPWNLLHVATTKLPLCSEPCRQALEMRESCQNQCQQKISRSCTSVIYQAQVTTTPLNNYHWPHSRDRPTVNPHLPIFALHISSKAANLHPLFREEYAMSATDMAGQLGALMEFWLGINIIAIIHLAVYILKKKRDF